MNIKRAKEEIEHSIHAYLSKNEYGEYRRPLLLIGPPGIGKTQIMEQVARECKVALVSYTITHHTRQSAVGLPFIREKEFGGKTYSVTEYTMSEIIASVYEKIEQTGLKEGILFIDEINCVSETLAPTMLQFLQCKTFGNQKVPEGWVIVAAGNPPEYNRSVREFDVVTLDRIKKIDVEADFSVWKEYAYQAGVHQAVISYLELKKENFYRVETTVDGKMFATARGWEDLSQMIGVYEDLGLPMDREVVYQYIQHWKIAKDFANYLELYYKYQNEYQVDEILRGVIREALCGRVARAPFDERLSVTCLILSKLTEGFKKLWDKNAFMELLMEQLKSYRQEMAGRAETSAIPDKSEAPAMVLASLAQELEKERFRRKKSGLSGRREDRLWLSVRIMLEEYAQQMRKEAVEDREQAWEWVRTKFMEHSDCYEAMKEDCGSRLEHAFDFMEAAFGNGQEMVIFVTELNTSEACVRFLDEYECERYYQYNKDLLFDEQEQAIRQKL